MVAKISWLHMRKLLGVSFIERGGVLEKNGVEEGITEDKGGEMKSDSVLEAIREKEIKQGQEMREVGKDQNLGE